MAHDPVRERILDRVAVQLALSRRAVLSDIRQPNPVRGVGTELSLDVVIEYRRAGLLPFAAAAALRGREDPRLRAQLPRRPPTHPPPRSPGLVGQVSVSERRVVMVRVVQRVDPVRAEHVRIRDRG